MCDEIRTQLGALCYQWLCACAIYPGLKIALTIHLGNVLAREAARPTPNEAEIRALCSLEWFRTGRIPTEIRGRLISDLLPAFRMPVRRAIERYLFEAIESDGVGARRYSIVHYSRPPSGWSATVREFIHALVERSAVTDAIFIKYMVRSRRSFGMFSIEGKRARVLGARFAGSLDLPIGLAFLFSLILCAIVWLYFPPPAPPGAYIGQVIDFRWTYSFATPHERRWTYLGNGVWQEYYAADPVTRFATIGHFTVNGCAGTFLQKSDNLLQAFVPDKGCPNMSVVFKTSPGGPWELLGVMSHMQYALGWRGASRATTPVGYPQPASQATRAPVLSNIEQDSMQYQKEIAQQRSALSSAQDKLRQLLASAQTGKVSQTEISNAITAVHTAEFGLKTSTQNLAISRASGADEKAGLAIQLSEDQVGLRKSELQRTQDDYAHAVETRKAMRHRRRRLRGRATPCLRHEARWTPPSANLPLSVPTHPKAPLSRQSWHREQRITRRGRRTRPCKS
ncbi:hypothetical protein [Caballeronia sp. dw_19]|uniref:hypothetical protein n=1 Tax=Caballeronia sp. dw_19 TaxID=2719791 RepID=UPI001BD4BAAF|nr:hypothetical protein [Caballeronia sp. dw_19]